MEWARFQGVPVICSVAVPLSHVNLHRMKGVNILYVCSVDFSTLHHKKLFLSFLCTKRKHQFPHLLNTHMHKLVFFSSFFPVVCETLMFVSPEHFQSLKQSVKVKNEWEKPINYDPLLKLACS